MSKLQKKTLLTVHMRKTQKTIKTNKEYQNKMFKLITATHTHLMPNRPPTVAYTKTGKLRLNGAAMGLLPGDSKNIDVLLDAEGRRIRLKFSQCGGRSLTKGTNSTFTREISICTLRTLAPELKIGYYALTPYEDDTDKGLEFSY
jgi:hypothetical protein